MTVSASRLGDAKRAIPTARCRELRPSGSEARRDVARPNGSNAEYRVARPNRSIARRVTALVMFVLGAVLGMSPAGAAPTEEIVAVEVTGEIDLGVAPYLDRIVAQAEERGAAAVIIEIDTPGGRLDAVLQMRDSLLGASVPTIAFVDRAAFSAGALVAIASEQIWMAPGSVMGAATPVDAATGETASEKIISAVRSTFRSTAQQRGRDPQIAEAMVDGSIAIDGLVAEGELLTLTTDEAVEVGYSDGVVADRAALLDELGFSGAVVTEENPSAFERLVRVVTSPLVASLLVSVGTLLVIGDVLLGGFGAAAAAGFGLLALFAYGHLLAGLAGWEDLALIVIGVALLLVEVFVIPGFGIAGVLGLAGVFGGGVLAMLGRDFEFVSGSEVAMTAATMASTFVVAVVLLVATVSILSRRRAGSAARRQGWLRWLGDGGVLQRDDDATTGEVADATTPAERTADVGAVGTALTDLRPAGVADFDGHRVDVVTDGAYLEAGTEIEVLRAETYRRIVRRRQR